MNDRYLMNDSFWTTTINLLISSQGAISKIYFLKEQLKIAFLIDNLKKNWDVFFEGAILKLSSLKEQFWKCILKIFLKILKLAADWNE